MATYRFAILLICVAVLAGCDSSHPVAVTPAVATAPTATAPSGGPATPAPAVYQASGPLVVENQVDLAAERDGVVSKILVDVGARVRKGDLLAQFDDRQLAAQHEAAVAKALSAQQDEKNWGTQIKLVELDLSRDEQLFQYQLITKQQLDHTRYKLVGAREEHEREVQTTREAQNLARSLEIELEKTRIRAPFDGVVARRYIRAGQNVAKNDRLFWVTATAPLNVRFTLPQELIAKIKRGEMLAINAPGEGDHQARVTLVSPVVDPSSGTIEVQAQVVGDPGGLRPGMTVNVQVKTQ